MMKKLQTVILMGFAAAVPIQEKTFYGMGTEMYLGTPAQRYFMGVEFCSTELRLFAGPRARSPFLTDPGESSSLQPARRGAGLVDNVTLAGVHFDNVGVTFLTVPMYPNHLHALDSHGVLGLGPQSRFALECIIALRKVDIEFIPTRLGKGFDLEMITVVPERGPMETEDVAVPVFESSEGWMTNGTIHVGRFLISSGIVRFDPMTQEIEIPREDIKRLLVVLKIQSPKVYFRADDGGVTVPCDAEGRITIDQSFTISVGDSRLLVEPSRQGIASGEEGMCLSQLFLNMRRDEWRINPFRIDGLKRVFFDAEARAITFRLGPREYIRDVLPALPAPVIPYFSTHTVVKLAARGTRIEFASNPTEETRYYIMSLAPTEEANGRLLFTLIAVDRGGPGGRIDLPGRYRLAHGSDMRVEPDSSISLALRGVSDKDRSHGTYTVSIENNPDFILIVLEPPRAKGTVSETARIYSLGKETFTGKRILGK